jgi:hypothetical protein
MDVMSTIPPVALIGFYHTEDGGDTFPRNFGSITSELKPVAL